MKIGVVIPFYQREAGILPRALNSIRNQVLPEGVRLEVVVVDDESPVSAASEMAGFADADAIRWTSVVQKNGGPGTARNTGIDRLVRAGDVEFVAFLDSNDEWRADHLNRALAAMAHGGDFYFSSHARTGDCENYFTDNDAARPALQSLANAGRAIADGSIRLYEPDEGRGALTNDYLSQTSTVVLRLAAIGPIRFDPDLRHAGEDYMFWIQLALKGLRVGISTEVEVICGSGLNMYHGAYDWSSPGILLRLSSEIIFHQKLVVLPLGQRREKAAQELAAFRRLYSYLFVRRLAGGRLPAQTGIGRLMRRNPALAFQMPWLLARFLLVDRRKILAGTEYMPR